MTADLAVVGGSWFYDDIDKFKTLFVARLVILGVVDLDQRDDGAQAIENEPGMPFAGLLHIAIVGEPAIGIHAQQFALGTVEFHVFQVI